MKSYCLLLVFLFLRITAGAQTYPALDSLVAKMPVCIKNNSELDCNREFFWAVKDMVLNAYATAEKKVPQAGKAAFAQQQAQWAASADFTYATGYKNFKDAHPKANPMKPINDAERKDAIAMFKNNAEFVVQRIRKLAAIINKK